MTGADNERIKVKVIAPYEGLSETVAAVSNSYRDRLDIDVVVGDLKSGLLYAKNAEREGADAIVSRGGTAEMIKKEIDIPVFAIQVSGYDYMRAIKLAGNIRGLRALVGFQYITERAHSVNELLGTDIDIFTVLDQEEIEPLLNKLMERGYELVIGDAATCRVAEEIGMRYLLLTSGEESVADAFESVINCISSYSSKLDRLRLFEHILADGDKKLLILSEEGEIVFASEDIEVLGLSVNELRAYGESMGDETPHSILVPINEDALGISMKRVSDGRNWYSLLFVDRMELGEDGFGEGVKVHNFKMNLSREGFLRQNDMYAVETVRSAESFCSSDLPILITGDEGVGKANLALTIHRHSKYWDRPFIEIDCTTADPLSILKDIQENKSVLTNGAVFCLEAIESVKQERQRELKNCIAAFDEGYRFMATARSGLERLAMEGRFDGQLYQYFSQLSLYVPNLNESKHNLSRAVYTFVREANARLGKQIAAVEEDAMKLIEELDWPYNYDELKQAIFQMVLMSEGNFLRGEDVRAVMEARHHGGSEKKLPVLSGTLEEIELSIIKAVLREEDGNMSKAAKRLGIGRSTLWRKLRDEGLDKVQ